MTDKKENLTPSENISQGYPQSSNHNIEDPSGVCPAQDLVIPEVLEAAIKNDPKAKAALFAIIHKGPLPAPHTIAAYEKTIPGSANRILLMAEKQLDHGIDMDRKQMQLNTDIVKRASNTSRLGMILAFIITLVFAVGSIFLLSIGKTTEGLAAIAIAMAAIIVAFITGKSSQTKKDENPEE